MKVKKTKITDQQRMAMRMECINIAARLPEAEAMPNAMMSQAGFRTHGKTAEKVVSDAEKLMAFVLK